MSNFSVIIMAAGQGKRMQSDNAKVLAKTVADKTLLEHVLINATALQPKEIVVVVGHQAAEVQMHCERLSFFKKANIKFALQAEQLGTGHAVQTALPFISAESTEVLILSGDVPLVKPATLTSLFTNLRDSNSAVALIAMEAPMGSSYGRVIRNAAGEIMAVTEKRDCSAAQLLIKECNSSIYACNKNFLIKALKNLSNNNSQKEFYLTDIIASAAEDKLAVASVLLEDPLEVQGVNTFSDLTIVNKKIRRDYLLYLMQQGITFSDPDSAQIDPQVKFLGPAYLGPNVQITGGSEIATGVKIEGNSVIKNSKIGPRAIIKNYVVCEDSVVLDAAQVGPFAHLRAGTHLGESSKIGNFVETKNAKLHKGVKASHLSYLGDCEIGQETNIGAGTIFANYDGQKKHKTTVGENCFIGSNSTLVAPINIGEKVTIGAGSVIRTSISKNCLALTKGALKIIENWSKRKK